MPPRRVTKSGPVALGPCPDKRAVCVYRAVRGADPIETAEGYMRRSGFLPLRSAVVTESADSSWFMVAAWVLREAVAS